MDTSSLLLQVPIEMRALKHHHVSRCFSVSLATDPSLPPPKWQPLHEDCAYSVRCLAQSCDEEPREQNAALNLQDRRWNWKDPGYQYCASRAKAQPGYVGSYCMDGLAMALHCVWTTESYKEAVLKVVNMRGDADTTGAITAQLAGAVYGFRDIPKKDLREIRAWDPSDSIIKRAARLYRNEFVVAGGCGVAIHVVAAAADDDDGVGEEEDEEEEEEEEEEEDEGDDDGDGLPARQGESQNRDNSQ